MQEFVKNEEYILTIHFCYYHICDKLYDVDVHCMMLWFQTEINTDLLYSIII